MLFINKKKQLSEGVIIKTPRHDDKNERVVIQFLSANEHEKTRHVIYDYQEGAHSQSVCLETDVSVFEDDERHADSDLYLNESPRDRRSRSVLRGVCAQLKIQFLISS